MTMSGHHEGNKDQEQGKWKQSIWKRQFVDNRQICGSGEMNGDHQSQTSTTNCRWQDSYLIAPEKKRLSATTLP